MSIRVRRRSRGAKKQHREHDLAREMSSRFRVSFSGVTLRTDAAAAQRAESAGARAYTDGTEIGFARGALAPQTAEGARRSAGGAETGVADGAFAPRTTEGARTLAHEFAHVAQLRGGNLGPLAPRLPTTEVAEWQARRAANAVMSGQAPRVSPLGPSGVLHDKGNDADSGPRVVTSNDEEALAVILKSLDAVTEPSQRSGLIQMLAGLAVQKGPVQGRAEERIRQLLSGDPKKDLGDHISAVMHLQDWVAKSRRAYSLLLYGRLWFADRSKAEVGSSLVVSAFQTWLHYQKGQFTIAFLRERITGSDPVAANLAGRIAADLLERENTPDAQKYRASYAALRAMVREHGWESYGALGAASATSRIFAALQVMRDQCVGAERAVRLGPVGDAWEDADTASLKRAITALGGRGVLRSGTGVGALVFTAENREETEHELLLSPATFTSEWLLEMARATTLAVDAGATLEARMEALHANARALDDFLGASAARNSDERQALFDLRHEYVEAWLSLLNQRFAPGAGLAAQYQRRIDEVERKFAHFDEVVAVRKFKASREHFGTYSRLWNEGNLKYPGNQALDEKFFFVMRDVLARERENLSDRYALGFSVNTGSAVIRMPPSDAYIPTDLRLVAALERDTSIFGMQAAIFMLYATNLSIHNIMLKMDVGSDSFRATQGARLSAMRTELEGFWNKGNFDAFFTKTDGYEQMLGNVVEKIKDRAKLDLLLNIAITLIAALVTWGAALAVRVAALSETLALARTARVVASMGTLMEVGVFTATELSLRGAVFGKELTVAGAVRTAATNLAFVGALKAVGKLAEPLGQGSAVRQLMFGHLMGFSGVAAVSATMTRIETGEWPPDVALFLAQTAATYLLLAGLHLSFQQLVAKPTLLKAAGARLENLKIANSALADSLRTRVNEGTLTAKDFEGIRSERIRLVEEVRALAQILRDGGVISAADMAAVNKMADGAAADAKAAVFVPPPTADPVVRALPAPETAEGLVRVGESNTYSFDPSRSRAGMDAMLMRYKERGYTVRGTNALMQVLDPRGRTRFVLAAGPVASTRLLLPMPSGQSPPTQDALTRATGLSEPQLSAARTQLAAINARTEATLAAEYPDHTVLATLALLVEQSSVIQGPWPIDSIRGVADALVLERGIPRVAVRRLFASIDPKRLPGLFADFHDIVTSPKVKPGSQFLIADDLIPKNSLTLIDAWRRMQRRGLELPADMDRRAVRGLARQIDKMPGGWEQWISGIAREKRADSLRAMSGLVDPRVRLPQDITEVLEYVSADVANQPGLSPLTGTSGEDFVKQVESRSPAGRFSDPTLRMVYVAKVDRLRMDAARLQQGQMARGDWENIVGRANEVRQTAAVLLSGGRILVSDRDVGPKGPLPNVDLASFALPGGGHVKNAPKGMEVHLDLLFTESAGALVALELTTAELGLPGPCRMLDPQDPSYGGDLDWSALDKSIASHRKFMQAVKIYQLGKMAAALGTAWSGQPVNPAMLRIRAGDFSAPAARALENLGFQLERSDGVRETAAQIAARKSSRSP